MKLKYNLESTPVCAETQLVKTNLNTSLFFCYKEDYFQSIDITVRGIETLSEIFSITSTKTKTKVNSNTDSILGTDVIIDNVPYFYELVQLTNDTTKLSLNDIILNSYVEGVVEFKGKFYCNTEVVNLRVNSNTYIFTKPIYTPDRTIFKSDVIETIFNKPGLTVKPESTSCMTVRLLNNKVAFNSFYCKKDLEKNIYKVINSGTSLVKKTEYVDVIGNKAKLKDAIIDCDYFFNKNTNSIYFPEFYFKNTLKAVTYTALIADLCFDINSTLYLTLDKKHGLVKTQNPDEANIIVQIKTDFTKLKLYSSQYLTTFKHVLPVNDLIIVDKYVKDINKIPSLKQQVVSRGRNPSEVYYVEHGNRFIYQHKNSIIDFDTSFPIVKNTFTSEVLDYTPVPKEPTLLSEVCTVLPEYPGCIDTSFNTTDLNESVREYKYVRLDGLTYYRNKLSFIYSINLESDFNLNLLLQDAKNILYEF